MATSDHYSWPDVNCLKNKLGIKDAAQLAAIEARIVSVRDVEVARRTLPGAFNLEHLKAFHRALFRDLYDWAGETRTIDISKAGSRFCHWRYVDDQLSALLADLAKEHHLLGLTQAAFLRSLAYYYGELNVDIHSARETVERCVRSYVSWALPPVSIWTGRN